MYQPRYLSLHEAVQSVADHLAKTDPRLCGDAKATLDAACKELVLALYEGAVHAEGLFWEPLPPDDYAEKPLLPLERNPIDKRIWSNEKCHIIKDDDNGKHSKLDVASVSWGSNSIVLEDEWETQYIYHDIRITASDIEREFFRLLLPIAGEVVSHENGASSNEYVDPNSIPEVTYTTGERGRRTSMHILEPEMRGRFARGEQLRTRKAEAEFFSQWLSKTHPGAAPTKPKTIQNSFRRLKIPFAD
jgi:hypothetical protein